VRSLRSSAICRSLVVAASLLVIFGLAACETVPESSPGRLGQGATAHEPVTAPPAPTTPPGAPPEGETAAPPLEAPPAPTLAAPSETGPVKVALLLPLSGANAAVGRALLDAAQLALFDAGNDRLALLPRDTGATPEGAAAAAEAALSEGAQLILGPLFAAEVTAVAPLARARGINLIGFSTDRTVAGDGVYLLGFSPEQQVERVVSFASARGLHHFAALAPETPYGNSVVEALRRAAVKAGGSVSRVATYPPDTVDFTAVVRRFADFERRRGALAAQKQALAEKGDEISREALRRLEGVESLGDTGFDALLLAEGGARLKALAPILPYYDIDPAKVRFFGTGQWDQPDIVTEPALLGGWFPAAPPASAASFRARFESAYGRRPLRIASLGYDAVALAAVLAQQDGPNRFGRDAIANPNGFIGFDGIFRFGAAGIAERGLAVMEIQSKGFKVVDPAPETFESIGQ